MTKISFDLDFSKDSETLLKEIQDKAKSEVEKRETKERANSYLSELHQKVNEEIGTSYKSATDLIRALSEHASPLMRERISGSSPTGRRKTVSMTRELYQQIKDQLDKPSPNKAAIAREIGVSVVQVRKVAAGGFEDKFSDSALPEESQTPIEEAEEISVNIEESKVDAPDPIVGSEIDTEDEIATSPESLVEELPETGFAKGAPGNTEESISTPEPPSPSMDSSEEEEPPAMLPPPDFTSSEEETTEVVAPTAFEDDPLEESPIPSEPIPDLPPVSETSEEGTDLPPPIDFTTAEESQPETEPPLMPPSPPESLEQSTDVLPPPDFDPVPETQPEESIAATLPPPVPSPPEEAPADEEVAPPAPPPPSNTLPEPPAPPESTEETPVMPPPPAPTSEESEKAKPSLKLGGGKKKTKLKLGGGKSGSGGLPKGKFSAKITRPPMAPGSLPPPPPTES